jgi:malate/lactate dehydrogenase
LFDNCPLVTERELAETALSILLKECHRKALDLQQAMPVIGKMSTLWDGDYEATANSDIIVIAGLPRKPGMRMTC